MSSLPSEVSGISTINTNTYQSLFSKTIEKIESQLCYLFWMILILGVVWLGALGGGFYLFIAKYEIAKFGTSVKFFFVICGVFITSLLISVYYLLKLSIFRNSLTNKLIALSSFDEIQNLLKGDAESEPSFEYRASIKKLMESINDLVKTD